MDFNRQPFWGGGFLPGWIVKHAEFIRFDSSRVGYHLGLGFRLSVRCRLVAVWWMANMRSFCFIIAFHDFATLKYRFTYQRPSSWLVVITMKKKLAGTWKKIIGYWPVQITGNKFATGQILRKPVEVVKGRILAGWALKSPEPCSSRRPGYLELLIFVHCLTDRKKRPPAWRARIWEVSTCHKLIEFGEYPGSWLLHDNKSGDQWTR